MRIIFSILGATSARKPAHVILALTLNAAIANAQLVTGRLNYTATTSLSLQCYAEPFITLGRYCRLRELVDPRAARYEDRHRPYSLNTDDASFNLKELHANAVVRLEYRPASTVFVVWTHGKGQDRDAGSVLPVRDFRNLFSEKPDNTFLINASYWMNF